MNRVSLYILKSCVGTQYPMIWRAPETSNYIDGGIGGGIDEILSMRRGSGGFREARVLVCSET